MCGLRPCSCGDPPGCHVPDAGRSGQVGAAGLQVARGMARTAGQLVTLVTLAWLQCGGILVVDIAVSPGWPLGIGEIIGYCV